MSDSKNEMMQLIYYDLSFNENFENYLSSSGLTSSTKDYNTVAIIGCQSSGKSTLLNNLFNTTFEVMVEDKGRGQTTQGIWVAMNPEYKVMILDCEGTDSKERGEERFKFEHCSSLFALAMADLLIINMWTNDVGRYTASNYGVLKVVFEMNLKLFQQECDKRILIVLRDFDSKYDDKSRITELILNDIYKIWKEIKKPEKFKDYTPNNFFKFEFTTLSHKFYYEDNFISEIKEMRKRLTPNGQNFLFQHVQNEKVVPLQGLALYCRKIWEDIISDKDLNIPSQKEMLANFKCNEIKDLAIQQYNEDIDEVISDATYGIIDNFKSRCETITKNILKMYDEPAQIYMKTVYEEIRRNLILHISQRFFIGFDSQIKKHIPNYQKNMRSDLEKELKSNENFLECALKIKKIYLTKLINTIQNIKYFDQWEVSIDSLEESFDQITDSQRKFSLEDKKNETLKKLKSIFEDSLLSKLEEISPNFWVEFNQEYFIHFFSLIFSLKDFFSENFKMDENEFKLLIADIENDVHLNIKKDLYKNKSYIYSYAVESFRKKFCYDEGIPRVWNKMSEQEIDTLYKTTKNHYNFINEIFDRFKLISNPLVYVSYQKPSEEQLNNLINDMGNIINAEKFNSFLDQNDTKLIKAKYEEGVQSIFEDAKRRHLNIQKQSLPIWALVLIVYLGYDDIWNLVTSYWIIPVIILFSLYGTLHALGMGHIPKMIFNLISSTVGSSFNSKK